MYGGVFFDWRLFYMRLRIESLRMTIAIVIIILSCGLSIEESLRYLFFYDVYIAFWVMVIGHDKDNFGAWGEYILYTWLQNWQQYRRDSIREKRFIWGIEFPIALLHQDIEPCVPLDTLIDDLCGYGSVFIHTFWGITWDYSCQIWLIIRRGIHRVYYSLRILYYFIREFLGYIFSVYILLREVLTPLSLVSHNHKLCF